jgi:antitoxin component YwqK of YwqJK toxin-antitoxin module
MEILPSGLKIVMTLENYKNGKLEGLRSVYYPSGKIAEEISYLNNMKNGL